MKDTYKNGNSSLKHVMRQIILNHISNHFKSIPSVFSLPASNFIFEQLLLDKFPHTRLTCVERNETVFNKGMKIVKSLKNNINFFNRDTHTELLSTTNTFNMMWLDYCAQISHNIISDLRVIKDRDLLRHGGLLAITLMGKREQPDMIDIMNRLAKSRGINTKDEKFRQEIIPRAISNLFNNYITPIHIIKYLDSIENQYPSPMYLYLFKIDKKQKAFFATPVFEEKYLNSKTLKLY